MRSRRSVENALCQQSASASLYLRILTHVKSIPALSFLDIILIYYIEQWCIARNLTIPGINNVFLQPGATSATYALILPLFEHSTTYALLFCLLS